ncbi:MAG TPA: PAS domain-containing protein [Steroidobacteraceae bacterium]|nr:PAS domain-containing protein [Steroidobacteraceae bacterium]
MADNDSLTERQLLERLSIATQAAGIFVWELDWTTNQLSSDENRLNRPIGNRHFGQELGRDLFRWVHPDDGNIGHKAIQEALAQGNPDASFRYRLRLADGSIRHLQAYARTTTDAAGQPTRSLGVSWDVTAEVEAAEQLRRTAEQERKLLEHLSLATSAAGIECFEFDYALEGLTWYHGYSEHLGEPTSDAYELGRRALASILPEDAAVVRAATEKALADGLPNMTIRMRRRGRDGEIRHLQLYQRFVRDGQGRPVRALGATRDITVEVDAAERFRAQAEALHDAQRRLERASLSSQEGHFETELETGKHWASDSYYALLGYTRGELNLDTLEKVDALIHPDEVHTIHALGATHFVSGSPFDVDLRLRHKDGTYRWFRTRGRAERNAQGRLFRYSGSVQDIHKQRLTEDALKAARQRFERAIRGTQDGLWEWDLVRKSLWVSPRFEAILGFAEGEVSGKVHSPDELVHADDLEACRAAQRAHFADSAPYDVEVRMRNQAGAFRWVRLRGDAERDEGGEPLRLAGSMQDVTESRAARDALIQASEAAQAASRSKSAFLANVSHEIRTPMNGIIGMTSLLLDSALDRAQREYAETIHASANSLLTVLNDILDFSKIEAGKLDIECVEMDLAASISEARAMLAFQATAKNLRFDVSVEPGVPQWVMSDRQRIRQCLVNLISNAIKFTRAGGVSVHVSVTRREQARVFVRFEVRDTGIGIAPETLPTLFQPFVQADSSTTRHFGGTGLGLSIVRRLIDLMGGEVGVTSDLGRGSRFWFVVPLQEIDEAQRRTSRPAAWPAALAHPDADAHALPAPFAQRYAGKVLLVEDNLINQKVAKSILERLGCEVTLAGNGLEAVHAFAQGRFELVLLDLQMPLMDGYAATSCIRKLEQGRPRTPIVALTASAMTGQRERCVEAGMDDLLTKPLDLGRLQAMLDRFSLRAGDAAAEQARPSRRALDDSAVGQLVGSGSDESVFELDALRQVAGEDADFLRELAETFVYTSEELLATLTDCARRADREGLGRAAHSLKGASASIRAEMLRERCAELESRASALQEPELIRHIARIAAERQRVVAALQTLACDSHRAARTV